MSDAFVFDKAKYHLQTVQDHDLPDHQAFVHSGLFFGWAVDRGLTQSWLEDNTPTEFAQFRARELTGPQLFAKWDGGLLDDMFTDEGLAFVCEYFPFKTGQFLDDYHRTLAKSLESEFHVPDTWDSFDTLAAVLDQRHAAWRATWDPTSGRPDTRSRPDAAQLPDTLALPVLPVTSGVVLPTGTLGIRASRASSVAAVEQAQAADGWIGLLGLAVPGSAADPGAADLTWVGVVARLDSVTPTEGYPDRRDVLVSLLSRFEVESWIDEDRLLAHARIVPDPPVSAELRPTIEEVRHAAADLVRRRMRDGHAPGMLALAPALDGGALLDVIAREVKMAHEEMLLVLEAPDLETRVQVVQDALRRL